MVEVAWVKCALNLSNEPKFSSMADPSAPSGLSPPSGLWLFQKMECSTWPEMWKASVFSSPTMAPKSSLSRAAASFSSVWLAPAT